MKEEAMKTRRRLTVLFLLLFCMSAAMGTRNVQAKTMKNTTGITWDLRQNKYLTYKSWWGGVGMITQKVKLSNFSETWSSSKAGYRVATFRLTFIRKKRPTVKQLIKAATYYTIQHPEIEDTSPMCYYAVVDLNTGLSLEKANPYGVIVKRSKWRRSGTTTYKTSGYSLGMQNISVEVQIEYPYEYKNMCIGVGGYRRLTEKAADRRFWAGTGPFWKTSSLRYVKYKKIAHFGRLWFDP